MPRGRGVDRNAQRSAARLYAANDHLEPWEREHAYMGVRQIAAHLGLSKSTVHRYVNQDALNADRRRSKMRRDRIQRQGRR